MLSLLFCLFNVVVVFNMFVTVFVGFFVFYVCFFVFLSLLFFIVVVVLFVCLLFVCFLAYNSPNSACARGSGGVVGFDCPWPPPAVANFWN